MTKRNDCEVIRPLLNDFNNTHLLCTSVIIADNQAMQWIFFEFDLWNGWQTNVLWLVNYMQFDERCAIGSHFNIIQ